MDPGRRSAEVTHGGETELIAGRDRLDEELGGLRLRISPHAFFQTNTEMAERLYGIAIELAELRASSVSTTCTAGSGRSAC